MVRSALTLAFGLIALGGIAFLALAAYMALLQALMPWAAGLITGGGLLALSIAGIRILYRSSPPGQDTQATASASVGASTAPADAAERLGQDLGASLQQRGLRTTDVMTAALVAGAVLGASPALREHLFRRGPKKNSAYRRRHRSE